MKYIKDFFYFLIYPYPRPSVTVSIRKKIVITFILLILYWSLCIIFAMLSGLLTMIFRPDFISTPLVTPNKVLASDHNLLLLFIITFIVPIIEELTFRLGLTEFNYTKVRISLSLIVAVIILLILRLFTDVGAFFPRETTCFFLVYYGVYCILGLFIFIILPIFKLQLMKFSLCWERYFSVLLYSSILLFTCTHIFTTSPVGLIPIFILACIFSYSRVSLGFKYALILHIFINMQASVLR